MIQVATGGIIHAPSPPSPGQLVDVRRRQWIVSDIRAESVSDGSRPSHLAKLASIDEDALGEEIEVLWELEPGASIIEKAGLPTLSGLDDPEELDAFLNAVRWGAATNADRGYLQAPFRSGATIEDYQLDPLVRAIDMTRTNLLIADDVGLGKTIEAGLVAQEMLLRHRVRTILVLCPASLQEKWRMEMDEKFGLDFCIVDTNYLKKLRRERGIHANPWTSFPRLIASIDWVKTGEGLRLLRDTLPLQVTFPRRFDLLIIDEAHNIAPSVPRNAKIDKYALESLRTGLVRKIAPHFQHKLFLTATPHNGYAASFRALLELLDDQRFSRSVKPSEAQLGKVMVRRLKEDIVDPEGRPLFPKRRLEALEVVLTQEERDAHKRLAEFVASREKKRDDRQQAKVAASRFIHQLLRKRLASSPAAFAATLSKHLKSIEGSTGTGSGKESFDVRVLDRAISRTEEIYEDDVTRDSDEDHAVDEAGRFLQPLSEKEQQLAGELLSWAQAAIQRPDSKAEALIRWLEEHLKPGGEWSKARAVLFTEYRATQAWLHKILASREFGGDRIALMFGGMNRDERERVKAAFQANPDESPVRILLATDAASEGIDLQNHCNLLMHVEIPYNPNVMEQRNGRIDRHGQKQAEVVIWHPVDSSGKNGKDILLTLRKLVEMKIDLGNVNTLIAEQLPEVLEGRRREIDNSYIERLRNRSRRVLKSERELRKKISILHERIATTRRELRLDPRNVENTVRMGLKLTGKPGLKAVSSGVLPGARVFQLPSLTGSWSRCLEGLEHPYSRRVRPITFDPDVAAGRDDVVLVHLNHPLVQMCLRVLRAEIWARDDVKLLNRVSARVLADADLEEPAVAVVSRLVITGGNHHRIHEELIESGGYLLDSGFRREDRVGIVRSWIENSEPTRLSEASLVAIRSSYEGSQEAILASVDARAQRRLGDLRKTVAAKERREIKDMEEVLDDLELALREELEVSETEQLELELDDAQRAQVPKDRAAVEVRLARIPEERKSELLAIRARYSDLVSHRFPVAAVLLVPGSFLEGIVR